MMGQKYDIPLGYVFNLLNLLANVVLAVLA